LRKTINKECRGGVLHSAAKHLIDDRLSWDGRPVPYKSKLEDHNANIRNAFGVPDVLLFLNLSGRVGVSDSSLPFSFWHE